MLKTSTHALTSLVVTTLVGCSSQPTGHGGTTSIAPNNEPAHLAARERSVGTAPSATRPTAPAPGVDAAPDVALAAEQRVTLPSQASFTAPTGWYLRDEKKLVRLWVPERDLTITIVDVGPAKDRDAAVAAAWAAVQPAMNLPVAQASDLPGRDGWEAMAQLAYVTPTAESRTVIALAMRRGTAWYVCLIDGKNAALQRRGAQVGAMIESLAVPGMIKETFAGKTAKLDAATMAAFAAFVEQARTLTQVPGAAVAVVHGGKIIFEQGFGVRELGSKAPVTPQTKFMIGSTTKALTTLMMARLIDAKMFSWNTAVTALLPTFTLGDAKTTQSLTMQHTVCACTGMPRRDLEFIFNFDNVTADARLASMQTMQPTTGFGETFQYSNLMVAAGGYVAAHRAMPKATLDAAYDATMQREVLGPLGMRATGFDIAQGLRGNHAMPHAQDLALSLAYQPIPVNVEGAVVAVRPAGAAWSTVEDLARYVELELANGKLGNKQWISTENLLRRRTPQIKIGDTSAYGLGLFLSSDNGLTSIGHGGNTIGFTSDLFMLPDHDIGVIVLSNAGGANGFRSAVHRRFLELIFDGKPEALNNLTSALERETKDTAATLALITSPPTTAWITPLLGWYRNADLGVIEIRKAGASYILDAGEWQTTLGELHDRDGSIKLATIGAPFVGLEFAVSKPGVPAVLTLDFGQQVYTFDAIKK